MPEKFLTVPVSALDGDNLPTTLTGAILSATTSLSGLSNGTAYRTFVLQNPSGSFTPAAAPSGFSDNFNRANGALVDDVNWFAAATPGTGTLSVSGNTLVTSGNAAFAKAVGSYTGDLEISVTYVSQSGGGNRRLILFFEDATDGRAIRFRFIGASQFRALRVPSGGSESEVAFYPTDRTPVNGDILKVRRTIVSGTRVDFTVYVNSDTIGTFQDTNALRIDGACRVGVGIEAAVVADDFLLTVL